MNGRLMSCVVLALSLAPAARSLADDASSLRLVPFPKQVTLTEGGFALNRPLVVRTGMKTDPFVVSVVVSELRRAIVFVSEDRRGEGDELTLVLHAAPIAISPVEIEPPRGKGDESYALRIEPQAVTLRGSSIAGLLHGAQTLVQLIRANRRSGGLPSLLVRDWPSLRWRCFQDDLTRGPSTRLGTLEHELDLGSALKLNLFTYYMEHQFAFQKHPEIGPPDGSLHPDELTRLVEQGRQRGISVLGNQQSFGHFGRILAIPRYASLRETADVLTPMKDETYQLLDDLYSEICPRLPFPMFNVCCDETYGLGEGPSKELAARIGVAGVYVRHVTRIHDLLRDKYHKRMMMWGDIIIQHPDRLGDVPKDTVMLAWDYAARDGFDPQIVPFAKSGFAFFVCPGLSNWSRILPDFATAEVNIRNFVRDGVKHGALGMINTSWEDDGEALKSVIWHGHAWAAECAWNASTTEPAAFNRRVGAVLFGEQGDHFGQAVGLLAKTHTLPGMAGMMNSRFWQDDFFTARKAEDVRAEAERLLALVRPAIAHLEACRHEATANADLLDAFLLGARRMELVGSRMLDGLEAIREYDLSRKASKSERLVDLAIFENLVRRNRDAHQALGREFARLWLRDCKPYALDWTTRRYQQSDVMLRFEAAHKIFDEARKLAEADQPGPPTPILWAKLAGR